MNRLSDRHQPPVVEGADPVLERVRQLTPRQFFALQAFLLNYPLTKVARELGCTRRSVYTYRLRAQEVLRGERIPRQNSNRADRVGPYHCETHGSDCPLSCPTLVQWRQAFNAAFKVSEGS